MKKIGFIIIGILLTLISIEFFLRIGGVAHGLIYQVPQYKEPSDIRIFCVGESTTWGIGAAYPLKENYPSQLEKMLDKRFPDRKTHCFFDETIGQNTSEILMKLPTYIKRYKPHIMLFMVGINNWWNLDKSNILLFNQDNKISNFTLRTLIFLDKFRTWKLFKWIFFSIAKYKERWDYGFFIDPIEIDKKELKMREKYDFHIFDKIAEYDLTEMVRICKKNQIKAIICSYPSSEEELYEVQKKVARENGVAFVDNFKLFDNLPDKKDYFASDVAPSHPNSRGYRLLAGNIYRYILQSHVIE